MFYNVENLFDTKNNPDTEDDEFTANGDRHWTAHRLKKKQLNISKVILNASGWNVPDLVAMCEVENRELMENLLAFTPLNSVPYKIIHKESNDERGIDVSLLYNSNTFFPLNYRYFPLPDKNEKPMKTREILYLCGIANNFDTLHIFINHWPSRYNGLLETRQLRNTAAKVLRNAVDSLNKVFYSPKIIIAGDFNDQPFDESIQEILKAKKVKDQITENLLYNLSWNWLNYGGTLKYQSQWSVFDQLIVSGSLLKPLQGYGTNQENAKIIKLPFLLEANKK